MSEAEAHARELLSHGYVEVTEDGPLTVGQRVRHSGEDYREAVEHGTAVLERIFRIPGLDSHEKDVQLIVRRALPRAYHNGTHGFWADYDTVIVRPF